jgi:rhodanese-related sulfurtransferase
MRAFGFKILVMATAALVAAVAVNALRPRGAIPWVGEWGHYVEAKALRAGIPIVNLIETHDIVQSRTHTVFDARPRADYEAGRLPGALSLPFNTVEADFESVCIFITPEQPILTYCSGQDCDDSFLLAEWLIRRGYTNVVLYPSGFDKWQAAGYPVERSGPP